MVEKRTTEYHENVSVDDVNQKMKTLIPALQIEYLENVAKRHELSGAVKILVGRKLSDIYNEKGMYSLAATKLKTAAEFAVTYNEQKELFFKVGELMIRAGEYIFAADAFKRAVEAEKPSEKNNMQKMVRQVYFNEADSFAKKGKTSKAIELYERIMRTPVEGENMDAVKQKLSDLYKRMGRIKDSLDMARSIQ